MSNLEYISFIAPWFTQPIADLFDRIFFIGCPRPHEVQTNPVEAAYSCSIILLSVAMLEGVAARAHLTIYLFSHVTPGPAARPQSPIGNLQSAMPGGAD